MKFLVFQHVPHEHPGLLKKFADQKHIGFDIIEFWKQYKIPNIEQYDALLIMGGPMGVYEDKDWIHKDHEINEKELLKQAKKNAKLMEQQCKRLFNNFLSLL